MRSRFAEIIYSFRHTSCATFLREEGKLTKAESRWIDFSALLKGNSPVRGDVAKRQRGARFWKKSCHEVTERFLAPSLRELSALAD